MGSGAHYFAALGERLEIDVCGEVSPARRLQRICEGMAGHGLQSLAQAMRPVTIVDDEGGALIAHAPADFHRDRVGTPFEDRVFRRLPQFARQGGVEVWQRDRGNADDQIAPWADLDDAFMPAV